MSAKPLPVDDVQAYWVLPPPAPSPRLEWWKARVAADWKPNRRLRSMGYHTSAEWFGVYIWEWINVLSPLLFPPTQDTKGTK